MTTTTDDKIKLEKKKKELEDQINEIKKEIRKTEEDIQSITYEENKNILDTIKKHKDIILPLIKHDRTSCDDNNTCNGYKNDMGYYRCNKCALIRALNGEELIDSNIEIKIIL